MAILSIFMWFLVSFGPGPFCALWLLAWASLPGSRLGSLLRLWPLASSLAVVGTLIKPLNLLINWIYDLWWGTRVELGPFRAWASIGLSFCFSFMGAKFRLIHDLWPFVGATWRNAWGWWLLVINLCSLFLPFIAESFKNRQHLVFRSLIVGVRVWSIHVYISLKIS